VILGSPETWPSKSSGPGSEVGEPEQTVLTIEAEAREIESIGEGVREQKMVDKSVVWLCTLGEQKWERTEQGAFVDFEQRLEILQ
jgi:hypothetical protein